MTNTTLRIFLSQNSRNAEESMCTRTRHQYDLRGQSQRNFQLQRRGLQFGCRLITLHLDLILDENLDLLDDRVTINLNPNLAKHHLCISHQDLCKFQFEVQLVDF